VSRIWARGSLPFAEEDEAERGEGVEGDPQAGDELGLEGAGRGLSGLLVRGQAIDVVDEAVG
jgi:hypothetical protein